MTQEMPAAAKFAYTGLEGRGRSPGQVEQDLTTSQLLSSFFRPGQDAQE